MKRLGVARLVVGGSFTEVDVVKPEGPLPAAPETEDLRVRPVVRLGDTVVVRYMLKNIGWETQGWGGRDSAWAGQVFVGGGESFAG